ncbi:trypsin-like serine peptidase [Acuticoccus sp.]|uniref:trypsin-like serine peptidase n=1 Tax=Acuticoccus sp. TaxID=1904378 RepID=UPI003B5188D6
MAQDDADPAVGRLNHAGYRHKRHCTAFAVAPRVVVTAAHCLAGLEPQRAHLLFGYARMDWVAHVAPAFAVTLEDDVALLCLADRAPAQLAVGPAPAAGDAVTVVGYGRPVRHLQSRAACRVLEGGGALVLDCPQSPGASGGPVLNAAGEAVAVVSRTAATRSLATVLPRGLARRCD